MPPTAAHLERPYRCELQQLLRHARGGAGSPHRIRPQRHVAGVPPGGAQAVQRSDPRARPLPRHAADEQGPEKFSDAQRGRLRELLRCNLRSVRAYLLKQDFQNFWGYKAPWAAKAFLHQWTKQVTPRLRLITMAEPRGEGPHAPPVSPAQVIISLPILTVRFAYALAQHGNLRFVRQLIGEPGTVPTEPFWTVA